MAALNGAEPPLPPLSDGYHLVEHLMDVGPVASNGMGTGPVGFTELLAWRSACGHCLDSWEMATIRAMSVAFSSALQDGESPAAPPPWALEPKSIDRIDVAQRIKGVLHG